MTSSMTVGQQVPNFNFTATNNLETSLENYRGQAVVIYFYPKDNTPGCTNESKDFRDLYEQFKNAGAVVFGISRDNLASHKKFKDKYELPFELISDPDQLICQQFKVIRPKLLFGNTIIGLMRSTFVIGPDGVLVREWRKVKVKGHAQEVLESVISLKK